MASVSRCAHNSFHLLMLFAAFGSCAASAAQNPKPDQEVDPPTTVWSNNPLPCPQGHNSNGSNGQAEATAIEGTVSIGLGPEGTLYFTSSVCVFRLDQSGTVTRIAGGGAPTKKTEVSAGKATKAYLPGPKGIAVDSRGTVFVAVEGGQIVQITRDGGLLPFYVNKQSGIRALTIDHLDDLYFLDTGGGVEKVTPDGEAVWIAGAASGFGGDGGPAKKGAFSGPTALASDFDGNIYIADTGNNRVRKVATDGTLSTVAGRDLGDDDVTSTVDGLPPLFTRLPGPDSIAVDSSGNLLIGESAMARIRKVPWSGGTVSSLFTYGGANYWGFFEKQADTPPTFHALAAGRDGFLYAVDDAHHQIIKISQYGDMDVVIRTQTVR